MIPLEGATTTTTKEGKGEEATTKEGKGEEATTKEGKGIGKSF